MKHRLELWIYKGLDVQLIHKQWLDPIDEALQGIGTAFDIMPNYNFNTNETNALKVIDLGNKIAYLQYYAVSITVYELQKGVAVIRQVLQDLEILDCSVLTFESEKCNLLDVM